MKFLSLLIFLSTPLYAGFDGILMIEGEVVAADKCDYKVKQSSGHMTLLPLKSFKKYLTPDKKIKARMTIEQLRMAYGHVVKRGSDLGGGSNTRGTDIGGGSNTRGTDIGGGSNTRNCHLRKEFVLNNKKGVEEFSSTLTYFPIPKLNPPN